MLDLRCRFSGGGIKPPNGAVVKSHGTERLGKDMPRVYQVWIKELNENEPLMRSREVAITCQKLRSMRRSDKFSGYLYFFFYWLNGRRLTEGKNFIRA